MVLQNFTMAAAGDVEIKIEVIENTQNVRVSGAFTPQSKISNRRNFGFLGSASGISGLGSRISDVHLTDEQGNPVTFRKLIDGEYLADEDFHKWEYAADLSPNRSSSAAAHVSWRVSDRGILMLDDLLPQFSAGGSPVRGSVSLNMPNGWASAAEANRATGDLISFNDISKAVIFLGKDLRERRISINGFDLFFTTSGSWHFTDDEAAAMAEEIFREHIAVFGAPPGEAARVAILRFPNDVNAGTWEAETRGRTVTIISSDMPFRTRSLQRLHEQLRHELFHLWLPNGVELTGSYAWFYEGFALYQSLKMAVRSRRIRFDDLLDTLSRAASIEARQEPRRPLFDPQNNISAPADTQTYARGMLVAFLLDIELLNASRGKNGINQVLRGIYDRHKPPAAPVDGNAAVFAAIGERDITVKYIKGSDRVDLAALVSAAGLEIERNEGSIRLRVTEKPNGRQKAILDRLGYNSWRGTDRRLKQ